MKVLLVWAITCLIWSTVWLFIKLGVRDVPPAFNAGCPLPTNVAGFGEPTPLEGYVQPSEVSPS